MTLLGEASQLLVSRIRAKCNKRYIIIYQHSQRNNQREEDPHCAEGAACCEACHDGHDGRDEREGADRDR